MESLSAGRDRFSTPVSNSVTTRDDPRFSEGLDRHLLLHYPRSHIANEFLFS